MEDTPIKAYYRQELVELYGVTNRTFVNWLKKSNSDFYAELKTLRAFTPKQVGRIFQLIGEPY